MKNYPNRSVSYATLFGKKLCSCNQQKTTLQTSAVNYRTMPTLNDYKVADDFHLFQNAD